MRPEALHAFAVVGPSPTVKKGLGEIVLAERLGEPILLRLLDDLKLLRFGPFSALSVP